MLRAIPLLLLIAGVCGAQTLTIEQARQELKDGLRHTGYATFLASLVDLGVDAEFEGGNFTVHEPGSSELSISPTALPMPFDVELGEGLPDLRAEVVVGYEQSGLKLYFSENVPGLHTRVRATYLNFAPTAAWARASSSATGSRSRPWPTGPSATGATTRTSAGPGRR
ncbi:MAG: hypothetical protein R3F62_12395 [Planctomycetota bacterium]